MSLETPNLYSTTLASPVGPLRLFATAEALTAVYLENHRHARALTATPHEALPVLRAAGTQLAQYFAGERQGFELPLAPEGTPFQHAVWAALREIPWGHTWSYAQLARHLGRDGAARAVGSANARNPLSILVPCHRVVGASGSLTGYAGGLAAKQWLLAHERRLTPR
ncbi:methylated-DNA--[protein]-cysteine S-methyltransferase [Archangium primigenium]|uniref:methylated-DNA--[protein]-cysteine S-methyltransferase n=1 Tax=[Archangium] primigenium TaxID=2792470 RepID=UPI0019591F68|nr:methylated-DNA--[protein]-cysteine S-methyltransferase [Archangium primigenium]MBM7113629.1 methylated-DNA--[protein]-cysteine S-methyltransferase [Archangium primigenium]